MMGLSNIDPAKLAYIDRKVDEVISGNQPPGVDHDWIKRSTYADRGHALELWRWHTYGKERCQADIKKVIKVIQRPQN